MLQSMGESLANNPLQVPQIVSDAVLEVIHATPGQRWFRNEVDKRGMEDPVIPTSLQTEKATEVLFTAYDMEGMMKLKTNVANAA